MSNVPIEVTFGVFTLGMMGVFNIALADEPLKGGMGLLTVITGFELFYSSIEQSLTVVGFLGVVNFMIALAMSYLTTAQATPLPDEESSWVQTLIRVRSSLLRAGRAMIAGVFVLIGVPLVAAAVTFVFRRLQTLVALIAAAVAAVLGAGALWLPLGQSGAGGRATGGAGRAGAGDRAAIDARRAAIGRRWGGCSSSRRPCSSSAGERVQGRRSFPWGWRFWAWCPLRWSSSRFCILRCC